MLYLLCLLFVYRPVQVPPESPVEWIGEMTFDAGDIPRDVDFLHTFRFRNITDKPLIIDNVRAGCGCTATNWAEKPVLPGEEGEIKVVFDAMNVGYFRKNVKVFFRGFPGGHKLWLEGFIEA